MADVVRVGDSTIGTRPSCTTGIVMPPAAATVIAGTRARARVTDRLQCTCGLPDFIVTGSLGVQVQGLPAARVGSKTMHGGTLMTGNSSVDVGGAWVGATFGNFKASDTVFKDMAAGRHPPPGTTYPKTNVPIPSNTITQSYNNCGIEASRQLIHRATGSNVSQEVLLNQAMTNGWAHHDPQSLFASGGSWATGRVPLLAANGVPAHTAPTDIKNVEQGVAEGKGVHADVYAARIWPDNVVLNSGAVPGEKTLPHAIVVTGTSYDGAGRLETVFINDTGVGNVNQPIPATQFIGAMMDGKKTPSKLLITDEPIW